MHPILFDFGSFTLYTYGVLLAAAYLLGLQFALMRAARPLLPAKYRYVEPYSDWVREGRRTPTLRSARPRG